MFILFQDEDADPLLSSYSQLKDVLNSITGNYIFNVFNYIFSFVAMQPI